MNSRSQINTNNAINNNSNLNGNNPPKERLFKEKLDTVHQNNSEVSIKEYEQKILPEQSL